MTLRRSLLILVALAVGAITPHVASAGHWYVYNGNFVHKGNKGHLPALSFYNRAGPTWTYLEHARGDWSGRSQEMDIYNLTSDGADIVAYDGRYCSPDWTGMMTPFTFGGNGQIYADGHTDQMRIQLDTCSVNSYSYGRAVACHEIGHASVAVFEDFNAASGGPGCMGVGYAQNANVDDPVWRSPNPHDLAHGGHLWYTLH